MGKLLSREPAGRADNSPRSLSLIVGGGRYSNTAAKFWSSILDEITSDYPACSVVEFVASDATALSTGQLFPEIELEREIERLSLADIEEELRTTLAQLDLLGPPAPVEIRLYADDQEILHCQLPDECVDAEIFPYLLVWILEWAGIPPAMWNSPVLQGAVSASDVFRRRRYRFKFQLENHHLSEGLYRRILRFWPTVENVPEGKSEENGGCRGT